MNNLLTMAQLEQAINYWRNRNPSESSSMRLCPQASALADLYGLCIVQRIQSIPITELSDYQYACFKDSLELVETPTVRRVA